MVDREPKIEMRNVAEVGQELSDLVGRVSNGESRVVVERDGKPLAAIISAKEMEGFERYRASRRRRFEVLDGMREPFKDVLPDEIEREVAKAVAEVRAANRTRADSAAGAA